MTPEARLFQAVERGQAEDVQKAVAAGADVSVFQYKGKSLLRLAGEKGHKNVCRVLVEAGLDPNEAGGRRGYSLIHNAVATRNFGFTRALLELGADPSAQSSTGETPLHIASRTGQNYLAERLANAGADVNGADNRGRTPLYLAVRSGDVSMVIQLMKLGADPTIMDRNGVSPKALSESLADDEITKVFDRNPAGIGSIDRVWKTPNKNSSRSR